MIDMHQPFDGPLRMEEERRKRELAEAVENIRSMIGCWWRDPVKQPPLKAGKYVVMVEEGYMAFLSTRSWSGDAWLNMNLGEKVTEWLDGLLTPAEKRAQRNATSTTSPKS